MLSDYPQKTKRTRERKVSEMCANPSKLFKLKFEEKFNNTRAAENFHLPREQRETATPKSLTPIELHRFTNSISYSIWVSDKKHIKAKV